MTLTATPDAGFTFGSWSGDCSGNTPTCTVTMNAAKSVTAFFQHASYGLAVNKPGGGTGTVASVPPGIDCGSVCLKIYDSGTEVTLTATPAAHSTFNGWTGDCTGTGTCVVTMDAAKSVTADFEKITDALTVTPAGTGGGAVTSAPTGINCGAICSSSFDEPTQVTLSAIPALHSTFSGWSGDCTGTTTCVVTMDDAKSVTATFTEIRYVLAVGVVGGEGTVKSDLAGIDCGSTCKHSFVEGDSVTVTAAPAPGFAFVGWSGDCTTGDKTCAVSMDSAKEVLAVFAPARYALTVSKSGAGSGTVVTSPPGGIDCGSTCTASYDDGAGVALVATAAVDSVFAGWSGDCSGIGDCVVTMDKARAVVALFEPKIFVLSVSTAGSGTVTSTPGGIDCGVSCSGSGRCTVTIDDSKTVGAAFALLPPPLPPPPPPKAQKKPPAKVTMCHNGRTIKVLKNQVAKHRRQGDKLGACKKATRRRP